MKSPSGVTSSCYNKCKNRNKQLHEWQAGDTLITLQLWDGATVGHHAVGLRNKVSLCPKVVHHDLLIAEQCISALSLP